jgi:predicted transcriptional regulator
MSNTEAGIAVSVRIDAATVAKIDALAEALSERAAGVPITRSDAIRVAIERGAATLADEMKRKK